MPYDKKIHLLGSGIVCLALLICLTLFTPTCYAAVDWSDKTLGIGNDKWWHVGVGYTVDLIVKQDKHISWLERKLIITGVGLAKEYSDQQRGGRMDVQDLGATVVGGLLGDIIVIRF